MSTIVMAGSHFLAAATNSGGSSIDVIGLIAIPLFLALVGAIVGIVRGATRFGRYMAHSEEAQTSVSTDVSEMRGELTSFIDKTDQRFAQHDQDIAVLKYATAALMPNGHPFKYLREHIGAKEEGPEND